MLQQELITTPAAQVVQGLSHMDPNGPFQHPGLMRPESNREEMGDLARKSTTISVVLALRNNHCFQKGQHLNAASTHNKFGIYSNSPLQ